MSIDTSYIRMLADDLEEDGKVETAKDFRSCADEIDALRAGRRVKKTEAELKTEKRARARARKPSRADRWNDACSRAREGLEELESLREEFENWRDNLPDNLQDSALGEKLNAIADLDISAGLDAVEECESAEVPLGFGRD